MTRLMLVVAVLAVALAVRVVVVPGARLDGATVVPALLLGAVAVVVAFRAESGGAR